jgi:hypothetical protein
MAALKSQDVIACSVVHRGADQRRSLPSLYIEKVLAPTLHPGDIVIMDNLGSHKANAVRRAIRAARRANRNSYA